MRKAPTARTVRAFDCQLSHEINNMNSIATSISTINVPFHGVSLFVVNHNGEPFTPMKPIVEGMGMVWAAQFVKLKQSFISTISEIEMVAEDGKLRKMLCLPLRKLAGWLRTISPNKVRPEIRERVIQYQEECDDVLYKYWTEGQVINPRRPVGRPRKNTTVDGRTPLRDAINMLVGKKGLPFNDAYKMVHQRFDVSHINELTPLQIPEAIEYIHRVVLDGEFLGRENLKIQTQPQSTFSLPAIDKDGEWVVKVVNGRPISCSLIKDGEIVLSKESFKELMERAGYLAIHYTDLRAMAATEIIKLSDKAESHHQHWTKIYSMPL